MAHEESKDQRIIIYTDGACAGNPGPGGWAYIICGANRTEISGQETWTTNNRMEMRAVIEALAALPAPSRVEVRTDSQYVVGGMTAWLLDWKVNGWQTSSRKPVANRDLWEQLDRLATNHDVVWTWVPGHAGDPENERCDQLAEGQAGITAEDRALAQRRREKRDAAKSARRAAFEQQMKRARERRAAIAAKVSGHEAEIRRDKQALGFDVPPELLSYLRRGRTAQDWIEHGFFGETQ